jgi:hypothetical protein
VKTDYYVWHASRKSVFVRLNGVMVRYMAPWVRDPGVHRAEAFGILLGRIRRRWRRTTVTVDDFEPFNPATLHGPPKPPPGAEFDVVGLYRRRLEGEELRLDHMDASLIETSFKRPDLVYLLIAPTDRGPDRATFFIQEDGAIHGYANYGEFPFDADSLAGQQAGRARSPRRWMIASGFAASLLALAGWFVWLRQDVTPPAPAAIAVPAETQPVVQQPPEPTVAPNPAPQERRVLQKKEKPVKKARRRWSRLFRLR